MNSNEKFNQIYLSQCNNEHYRSDKYGTSTNERKQSRENESISNWKKTNKQNLEWWVYHN